MRIENKDEYRKISISALGLSGRTYNCLKRAKLDTLYQVIQNYNDLPYVRNMGAKGIDEINEIVRSFSENGDLMFDKVDKDEAADKPLAEGRPKLSENILERPATDLNITVRIRNSFQREGIESIRQVVELSLAEISDFKNMGASSIKQLIEQVELLYEQEENYFKSFEECSATEANITGEYQEHQQRGKGFDFPIIDILMERFFFKPSCMADWFGLSRQSVFNVIEKRSSKRYEKWTGKKLTETEQVILSSLVESRSFNYCNENVICCCMNNRKDDGAYIFVYENEIKCFFLQDLPEMLQQMIVAANFHRFTERELSGEAEGDIIYCIKKPYFIPKDSVRFRQNAGIRGISPDEYAVFLSGLPLKDARMKDDNQIVSFLRDNMTDGKVYISSEPKNQWIRSLASRNGYSIKEFIELYGFNSKLEGAGLSAEEARERHIKELNQYIVRANEVYFPTSSHIYRTLNTYCYSKRVSMNEYIKTLGFKRITDRPESVQDVLEMDMQVRKCEGSLIEQVFAYYPLLGSVILKPETLEKLNKMTRKYIDTVLNDPMVKLPLLAEMQIALALVNNAKNWKTEENQNFWNFISLQFGYRDTNGSVVRILQSSLENAMKKNHRLFLENSNGREFKSTVVIHAFSTRKSWTALFDFLFDFYKNNLKWKVIPDDPLLAVMIRSLQQKLNEENTEDTELTISSHVYSFQEGIRKLILYRPVFTLSLFEKLIGKIDAMVNSKDKPAKTYEELLCEEWFKEKVVTIANTKRKERQSLSFQRDVAIDYSRIRAKLILENENNVQLVLPDIRLKRDTVSSATLSVYYNSSNVHQQNLSWYGNELGKTLHGVSVSLPDYSGNSDEMKIQVKISCDNEIIYDSEDTLYHQVMVFSGETEITASQMRRGNYTLVMPSGCNLTVENAEVEEIDDFKTSGMKAYFLELEKGYLVTVDSKLLTFDNASGTDIRVLLPAESSVLPTVSTRETEYYFAYGRSSCRIILGSSDHLQRFIILKDESRIELTELHAEENGRGLVFICPLDSENETCRIRIVNLNDERKVFDCSFIRIGSAKCSFNREFYYSDDDYKDANYTVTIDDFSETVPISPEDDEVRLPYRDGELHAAIPKIRIEETTGMWMNGTAPAWYIGNIPQSSVIKVRNQSKADIRFLVDGRDIMYEGEEIVTIGNVLQSFAGTDNSTLAEIMILVNGSRQKENYTVARVYYKERFLNTPEFWTEGRKLFWNRGGEFIGKAGRSFSLALSGESDVPIEFKLDENTEYVSLPENMEIGNYRYEISILSGSLFKQTKEVIAKGDCVIGDPNLLRFKNRRIEIETITDEMNATAGHIPIRPCYIDQIEFQGMEETSEGYCPIYCGILYAISNRGERYEFSYDVHTNNRGVSKMMVNPVRIVYVSDRVLCLTDSDGDGLYYRYYNDRNLDETVYQITDHKYTKGNMHTYSTADLYSYHTERI